MFTTPSSLEERSYKNVIYQLLTSRCDFLVFSTAISNKPLYNKTVFFKFHMKCEFEYLYTKLSAMAMAGEHLHL